MKNSIQKAAGYYLIKPLPDNWDELNMSEQDQFIQDNLWEPFQIALWRTSEIWECIEDLAKGFEEAYQEGADAALDLVKARITPPTEPI